MFLLANFLSTAGYLLALFIMLSLLLRRSYRYFGKKDRKRGQPLVRVPRPAPAGRWSTNIDSPEQVAKFEVQLQETMREISAQLDNKMICLQHLLRQANEKIARLEELEQMQLADGASASPPDDAPGIEISATSETADPMQEQIFALADQGFSPVTIAHRVAQPLREVEALLRARGQH